MLPNPALPNAEFGAAKLGMFVTLKISARSCRRVVADSGTFLNTDRSMRRCGGPCSVLFPVLPMVLTGWAAKAATLNHWAIVGLSRFGSPIRFGRSPPPVFDRAVPFDTG